MTRCDRRWRNLGILLSVLAWSGSGPTGMNRAWAQAEVRNPTQPVLVYQTGGHGAPVQALVFTPDGAQLLSGGMDRLLNVWVLNDGPARLSRTLRPPIWRGRRGAVYALALAPVAADGQRMLAVAGYGVESQYGNIGLYRYPGRNGVPTGDIVAQLPSGEAVAAPAGHTNVVRCLAFDPTGRYLASGSNDRTVRIWEVPARRTVAVLRGHTGPVTSLAFAFGGRRLITAGPDGSILLWDVRPDTLVPAADPRAPLFRLAPDPRPGAPGGETIKALAVADDGRRVVVGRQDGWLSLLAATEQTLARQAWLPLRDPPPGAPRGEVLALAFSSDGRQLAVSRLRQGLARASDPIDPRSEVEVRTGADLAVAAVIPASDLVNACAFSPDGKLLAFAGGNREAVSLRDATNPARVVAELSGSGSSVWDVGFTADSRALGFSWTGPGEAAPEVFWGFDLRRRAVTSFNRGDLRRALTTLDGWTLAAVDPFTIEARDPTGAAVRLALSPPVDGRWWSFTWVPSLPGSHPRRTVAVGTDSGNVVVFALDEPRRLFTRTRVLAGPATAVRAVAPSPDGRWLAGGSADQAIRLWTLAGCDVVPPLGATFAPRLDGRIVVSEVAPRSTAEAMGLKAGDLIERSFIGAEKVESPALAARIASEPQGVRLDLEVRRGVDLVPVGTSRRDNPALSLFVATDQEWILWMPQGYYETSIAGDRRFLGWHRNATKADGTGVDLARPTDYFSVDRFENELRRPAMLDRLLETADLGQALDLVAAARRDVPGLVAGNAPPAVALDAPGLAPDRPLVVRVPDLALQARAATEVLAAGRKVIRRLRVLVDARSVFEPPLQPPPPEVDRRIALSMPPGRHRVTLIATDDRGGERSDAFDVDYQPPGNRPAPPPAPAPREPRLLVIALGAGEAGGVFPQGPAIPPIPFAAEDARDVAGFLAGPGVQRYRGVEARSLGRFGNQPAVSAELRATLDRLESDRAKGDLSADDTVILLIESHMIRHDGQDFVLPTDAGPGTLPARAVPSRDVIDRLAALADYGCRVCVLVDGVYAAGTPPAGWTSRCDDFVRALYKRNVIVFTASIQGPGRRLPARGHGAFAEAMLTATPPPAGTSWTLDDFGAAVRDGVANLTQRRQTARLYVPGVYPGDRVSIFEPAARATARPVP